MKFVFKDLSPISTGEIELNKLTILCGKNNTGKTYITNTIYSFFENWDNLIEWEIPEHIVDELFKKGAISIDIKSLVINELDTILSKIKKNFLLSLDDYLACSDRVTKKTEIDFLYTLDESFVVFGQEASTRNFQREEFLLIKKLPDSYMTEISLIQPEKGDVFPSFMINRILTKMLVKMVLLDIPSVFIASAERTGATIFKNELNFGKNQLVKYLSEMENKNSSELNPFRILSEFKGNYALSVLNNVEFIFNLPEIQSKGQSEFIKNNPELIEDFIAISGGEYKISEKNGVQFHPKGLKKKTGLGMGESSSTVRALMVIWYWLNYVANENSILIIDEPELNLHPHNQRRFARFIASLIKKGIRVFITTHSDYIIREFNTLLLLNNDGVFSKQVKEEFGYNDRELLSVDDVNVYIAEPTKKGSSNIKIKETKIDLKKGGICVDSFDDEIRELNKIQDLLLYGN